MMLVHEAIKPLDTECQNLYVGNQISTRDGNYWHIKQSGEGNSCLLLHGTGASSHSWDNLVPLLEKHFQVITVDLPGHAKTHSSAGADLSLHGIASSLSKLLTITGITPSIIIGHSAGAAIMIEYCLQQNKNDIHLISINGAILPLHGLAGWFFSPLAKLSVSIPGLPQLFAYQAKSNQNVNRLLEGTGSLVDEDSLAVYHKLLSDPKHVAGVLKMMAQWKLHTLKPRLKDLNCPLLLIASTADKTIPLRDTYRLASLIRGSRVSTIADKGHLVHEEAAEEVLTNILENYAYEP